MSDPVVRALRAEHRRDALGIGAARPRLSWQTVTDAPGWWQTGCDIECVGPLRDRAGRHAPVRRVRPRRLAVRAVALGRARWASACVSAGRTAWSPRGRTRSRSRPGSSSPATGWRRSSRPPRRSTEGECPAWWLRREFELRPGFVSARLYLTALGVYEAELNGSVVGDEVLAPGWTVYDARLRYRDP